MKHLILLALVLTAFQTQAETYTCYFGNPFTELIFDSNSQILKENKSSTGFTILNVRLQELTNGELGLVSQQGQTLVTIKHTGQGFDGFTNLIYPFSAKAAINAEIQGDGSCETNSLRAKKPENSLIEE